METDIQRLNQILKNLLSNAFKFTEKGEVKLQIYEANKSWKSGNPSLDTADKVVAFDISDTGIGIPQEKQNIIFEAFQQAEGSTSRKYGGTGLGLSISRGLAELLGGTIELESNPAVGSTFTLYLPVSDPVSIKSTARTGDNPNGYGTIPIGQEGQQMETLAHSIRISSESSDLKNLGLVNEMINDTGDDRSNIQPGDKVVLVVEDDLRFGKILIEKAHEYESESGSGHQLY